MRVHKYLVIAAGLLLTIGPPCGASFAENFERPPIRYSESTPKNDISQLQADLDSGQQKLAYEPEHGYLKSLLQTLDIPVDSQTLVFSKSSVQARYISPATPRALYFNDDVYVGFCVSGNVLEVSVVDPSLGTVFYTLDQTQEEQPRFVRHVETCLSCHSSSRIGGVPGHLLRSHIVDQGGHVIPSGGIHHVDSTTPLAQRWGGWYVTGESGDQPHLGNFLVHGYKVPDPIDNTAGENVTSLADRFDVSPYLKPDSDIVALMVLEHQTRVHNYIVSANYATRIALYQEQQLPQEASPKTGDHLPTTMQAIQRAGDELVDALLMVGEVRLSAPIEGTSDFSKTFPNRGPRDDRGRSLRELDLTEQLFRYPCSYLIYSDAFAQLPKEVHDYVWQRLSEILTADTPSPKFRHISDDDRRAIVEILAATMDDLPASLRARR